MGCWWDFGGGDGGDGGCGDVDIADKTRNVCGDGRTYSFCIEIRFPDGFTIPDYFLLYSTLLYFFTFFPSLQASVLYQAR